MFIIGVLILIVTMCTSLFLNVTIHDSYMVSIAILWAGYMIRDAILERK